MSLHNDGLILHVSKIDSRVLDKSAKNFKIQFWKYYHVAIIETLTVLFMYTHWYTYS